MGKVTFVVDFIDGLEPQVSADTAVLGGKLVSVAWRDTAGGKAIPVTESLPPENESALLFDANGEGWIIGWRSMWRTLGGKKTGEWQWTFQIEGLSHDDVNITHYALIPEDPEVAE
ncbi:hypothetical protein [Serratia sp. JSRIV002]|uniref:hypothetical protein n=1 Tax=Serratia sp. JSRIV002 TaxID=2831894 RepID=UPI001CBB30BB|nr:hypothetical protein [Serratia sp. JSRIV002]